jgi:hypothetical protein
MELGTLKALNLNFESPLQMYNSVGIPWPNGHGLGLGHRLIASSIPATRS